jgi:hypothetical protein
MATSVAVVVGVSAFGLLVTAAVLMGKRRAQRAPAEVEVQDELVLSEAS